MTKRNRSFLAGPTALAAMTSLAGCGDADAPQSLNQQETAATNASITAPPELSPPEINAANVSSGAGNGTGARLPPPSGFRFVGLWAAEEDMCADKAWRITRETLETPAGSVCKFVNATPMDGGYDISARCIAEGPPVDDMLKIRFAESAQAMLFESESIADAGLIYCGPLERAR
jgi:hypothetical protein